MNWYVGFNIVIVDVVWKNACGCGPGSEWAVANKVDIEALKKTNAAKRKLIFNKAKQYQAQA